jgi:hypothetical protein
VLPSSPTAAADATAKDVVSVIQQTLKTIASEQERVIRDVCHGNSLDISQCVGEVTTMHEAVDDIKTVLIGGNEALHEAGTSLIHNARELDEMLDMQENLNRGAEALAAAKQVMSQCTEVSARAQAVRGRLGGSAAAAAGAGARLLLLRSAAAAAACCLPLPQVGQLIDTHQLYKACCLLDSISQLHLARLVELLAPGGRAAPQAAAGPAGSQLALALQRPPPPWGGKGAHGSRGPAAPGGPRAAPGGVGGVGGSSSSSSGRASDAVRFLQFLPKLVQDLTATVEHLAMADFNNWLVGRAGRLLCRMAAAAAAHTEARGRQPAARGLRQRSIAAGGCAALARQPAPPFARTHSPLRRQGQADAWPRPNPAHPTPPPPPLPSALQVSVRAEAKQIGLRAIRRAAIERQLEDDLARERRAVLAKLGPAAELRQLAADLVAAPFREELAREAAGGGGGDKWAARPLLPSLLLRPLLPPALLPPSLPPSLLLPSLLPSLLPPCIAALAPWVGSWWAAVWRPPQRDRCHSRRRCRAAAPAGSQQRRQVPAGPAGWPAAAPADWPRARWRVLQARRQVQQL